MRSSLASLVPSVSVRIARADIFLRGPRTTRESPEHRCLTFWCPSENCEH
jgi:hypothetical protein